jgi:hypothetical protein
MTGFFSITATIIIGIIAFYKIIAIILDYINEKLDCEKTKRHYNDIEGQFYDYHHKLWVFKYGYPKLESQNDSKENNPNTDTATP